MCIIQKNDARRKITVDGVCVAVYSLGNGNANGVTQMTAQEFNSARIAAEITTAQIADFIGSCRKEMLKIETYRRNPTKAEVSALRAMTA